MNAFASAAKRLPTRPDRITHEWTFYGADWIWITLVALPGIETGVISGHLANVEDRCPTTLVRKTAALALAAEPRRSQEYPIVEVLATIASRVRPRYPVWDSRTPLLPLLQC